MMTADKSGRAKLKKGKVTRPLSFIKAKMQTVPAKNMFESGRAKMFMFACTVKVKTKKIFIALAKSVASIEKR